METVYIKKEEIVDGKTTVFEIIDTEVSSTNIPLMTIIVNDEDIHLEFEDDYKETDGDFLRFSKLLKSKGLSDTDVVEHWTYFYSMSK